MKLRECLLIIFLMLAPDASADSICVATYNLNWSNRRGDEVLAASEASKADVLLLQETTEQSEDFLRRHLAKPHPHFHSIGNGGRFAGERFAFASKYVLADVKFTPPSAGLFGFYTATLRHPSALIRVVNAHLTPFRIKRGSGIREAMSMISQTERSHEMEINTIMDSIDCQSPTSVAGDFNSISSFCAPKRLAELGLIDSFASVHHDADMHVTWIWPTRPLPLRLRIDYIFHTPHFTAAESRIIRRDGSDHSLVVSKLEFEAADNASVEASGIR